MLHLLNCRIIAIVVYCGVGTHCQEILLAGTSLLLTARRIRLNGLHVVTARGGVPLSGRLLLLMQLGCRATHLCHGWREGSAHLASC